jgi:hypothetical protein
MRTSPALARRSLGSVVAALVVALVAAGCAAPPPDPGSAAPTLAALPSPVRVARTIPQPDGSIRIEAVSARVAANRPYAYPAFTHCGFTDNTFDFDGSFWTIAEAPAAFAVAAGSGNPPPGIENPTDAGVIVLAGPDAATWTSRGGITLRLARAGTEVRVFGCD